MHTYTHTQIRVCSFVAHPISSGATHGLAGVVGDQQLHAQLHRHLPEAGMPHGHKHPWMHANTHIDINMLALTDILTLTRTTKGASRILRYNPARETNNCRKYTADEGRNVSKGVWTSFHACQQTRTKVGS